MDSETISTVVQAAGGAAGAVKSIAEAVTALRGKVKGNKEAEQAVSQTLDLVIDLRTSLLDLQEKAFRLQGELAAMQEENMKLRKEIRSNEEGLTERKQYKSQQVGQSVVLTREDQPGVFYCPTCFETKHKALPLQPLPSIMVGLIGTHTCSGCKSHFTLG